MLVKKPPATKIEKFLYDRVKIKLEELAIDVKIQSKLARNCGEHA